MASAHHRRIRLHGRRLVAGAAAPTARPKPGGGGSGGRLRRRAAALAFLLLPGGLLAACGNPASSDTTNATTSPTTAAATTSAPSTTEPEPATTTTAGSTTTNTTASTTTSTTLPPWADPVFPEALPPEAIPWEEVGVGWLLVRYRQPFPEVWDPTAREALFLINPGNTMYAVSEWDRAEILDWSPEGRRVLIFDGMLEVIDLRDGTKSAIPAVFPTGDDFRVDARFTWPTGRDVVVRLVDWDDRMVLECLEIDGTLFAQLADFDLPSYDYSDPDYVPQGITWLYAPTGTEVVVATRDRISLLSNQGAVIRPLATPGLGCTLSRWWDQGSVLAACYDPDWAASPCWNQGPTPGGRSLWSVPIDGSAATRLTPKPVCTTGFPQSASTYQDALPLGATVAAQWGGCCECGEGIDLIAGDTLTRWMGYGEWPPCSPELITVRGDRLVVVDNGGPGLFWTILEVAADGTTLRAITPVFGLGEQGLYGGVFQVLTTEESSYPTGG